MFITIDKSRFHAQFHAMGRNQQFSYEALGLLYDYLEEISPESELDVIALCCEYTEASPSQIADDYPTEGEYVLDYLNDNTVVVGVTSTGSIVYAQF
jgi:hypothetical protein